MFTHFSNNLKGMILGLISFGAFAVSDATSKWLTVDYSTFQIMGLNNLFALLLVLILAPFWGGYRSVLKTRAPWAHAGRSICNVFISLTIITVFAHLQLATIYTLLFVSPFISTLLVIPLFQEQVSARGWISIIGGFVGVLIVLRPGFGEANIWLFVALLATLFIAGMWLCARALPEGENPLTLAVYPLLMNICVGVPIMLYSEGLPMAQDLIFFALCGCMLVLGLITGAEAFRLGKTSLVSPLHYTQMLWGIMFGFVLFGDVPDFWTLVGAVFIIGSGIFLIVSEGKVASPYEADHI